MDIKERWKKIKIWLLQNDYTMEQISKDVGVTSGMVSHVITGKRTSPRVQAWLREHGCPEEFVLHPKEKKDGEKRAV